MDIIYLIGLVTGTQKVHSIVTVPVTVHSSSRGRVATRQA